LFTPEPGLSGHTDIGDVVVGQNAVDRANIKAQRGDRDYVLSDDVAAKRAQAAQEKLEAAKEAKRLQQEQQKERAFKAAADREKAIKDGTWVPPAKKEKKKSKPSESG
jgi:hypothetical protein